MNIDFPDDTPIADLADALSTIGLAIDARFEPGAGRRASWVGRPTAAIERRGARCADPACLRPPIVRIGSDLYCADHYLHIHRVGGDL